MLSFTSSWCKYRANMKNVKLFSPNLDLLNSYWAALSLSFRRISMLMNIIAWGPQVTQFQSITKKVELGLGNVYKFGYHNCKT